MQDPRENQARWPLSRNGLTLTQGVRQVQLIDQWSIDDLFQVDLESSWAHNFRRLPSLACECLFPMMFGREYLPVMQWLQCSWWIARANRASLPCKFISRFALKKAGLFCVARYMLQSKFELCFSSFGFVCNSGFLEGGGVFVCLTLIKNAFSEQFARAGDAKKEMGQQVKLMFLDLSGRGQQIPSTDKSQRLWSISDWPCSSRK